MGRESKASEERRQQTHIIRWSGEKDDVSAFEATYAALASNRPQGERKQTQMLELLEALEAVAVPSGKPSGNPDLILHTLTGAAGLQISENDRTLLREAINAILWPVFALKRRNRALDLIEN